MSAATRGLAYHAPHNGPYHGGPITPDPVIWCPRVDGGPPDQTGSIPPALRVFSYHSNIIALQSSCTIAATPASSYCNNKIQPSPMVEIPSFPIGAGVSKRPITGRSISRKQFICSAGKGYGSIGTDLYTRRASLHTRDRCGTSGRMLDAAMDATFLRLRMFIEGGQIHT